MYNEEIGLGCCDVRQCDEIVLIRMVLVWGMITKEDSDGPFDSEE